MSIENIFSLQKERLKRKFSGRKQILDNLIGDPGMLADIKLLEARHHIGEGVSLEDNPFLNADDLALIKARKAAFCPYRFTAEECTVIYIEWS